MILAVQGRGRFGARSGVWGGVASNVLPYAEGCRTRHDGGVDDTVHIEQYHLQTIGGCEEGLSVDQTGGWGDERPKNLFRSLLVGTLGVAFPRRGRGTGRALTLFPSAVVVMMAVLVLRE
jgi:hypothetical protein